MEYNLQEEGKRNNVLLRRIINQLNYVTFCFIRMNSAYLMAVTLLKYCLKRLWKNQGNKTGNTVQ